MANISKEVVNKKIKILIYNEDYLKPISDELNQAGLNYNISGQFIEVKQPDLNIINL